MATVVPAAVNATMNANTEADERQPLVGGHPQGNHVGHPTPFATRRAVVYTGLTTFFVVAIVVLVVISSVGEELPRSSKRAALKILSRTPIIDGHVDLPILVRGYYHNNVTAIDLEDEVPGHVDVPRLRAGRAGGFFWSVYVACPQQSGWDDGPDFLKPSHRVRDTLEQIDVSRLLISKHSNTFELARTSSEVRDAMRRKKIASLMGVEGAHQLGNSIAVLRMYYELGVRYVTLTHTCANAFADSAGVFKTPPPVHGGLSPLGKELIREMNRIGMLVDLSHTADTTAKQAVRISEAPVIWSHSAARGVHNIPRNVPDDILRMIGDGADQKDGIIMVNFYSAFVAPPGKATVKVVADHVEYIASLTSRAHVGIGSDFDGIDSAPIGLEDVSQYPNLFAELYKRGWNERELAGLASNNLLRVLEKTEQVAARLQREGRLPSVEVYHKRTDL
jgi:membrane dipeptidase